MFCTRCGAPREPEARYCEACGVPLAPYRAGGVVGGEPAAREEWGPHRAEKGTSRGDALWRDPFRLAAALAVLAVLLALASAPGIAAGWQGLVPDGRHPGELWGDGASVVPWHQDRWRGDQDEDASPGSGEGGNVPADGAAP